MFAGLIETGNPWLVRLAVLAVLMSVVSLYYYIRFIRAMYIESETEPQPVIIGPPLRVALGVAAVLVLYIGIFPQRLISLTQKAGTSSGLKTHSYQQGAGKSKSAQPPGSTEPDDDEPVTPPR